MSSKIEELSKYLKEYDTDPDRSLKIVMFCFDQVCKEHGDMISAIQKTNQKLDELIKLVQDIRKELKDETK